ncbi:3665_t:CDS:2, partial [Cetraspora pellucida]
NDSTLQSNIQILATDNNFYQNSVEFNLNLEESLQAYQDYKNNLENYSNFDNNLEVNKFESGFELEDMNSLESRNKFNDGDELMNSLESENEVENNDELENSLENKNEFKNNIELENSLWSRNKFENNDELKNKGSDEYISRLKYEDSNNESESDSNNSTITDTSNMDIEVFEVQDFYAIVEYYLVYEFEESKVMLAYIQWTLPVKEDSTSMKTFSQLGLYAFINSSAIDYCVGFIEINKLFYIVDKEIDDDT